VTDPNAGGGLVEPQGDWATLCPNDPIYVGPLSLVPHTERAFAGHDLNRLSAGAFQLMCAYTAPDGHTVGSLARTVAATSCELSAGDPAASFHCWTNGPPALANPGDQESAEGHAVSLQIGASDPDGDPLTYSASGLPPSLAIDPQNGLISGTIGEGSLGARAVTVTVTDGTLSASAAFAWNVICDPATTIYTCPQSASAVEGPPGFYSGCSVTDPNARGGYIEQQGNWGTLCPNDPAYVGPLSLIPHTERGFADLDINPLSGNQFQLMCAYKAPDGPMVGALSQVVGATYCALSGSDPAASFRCWKKNCPPAITNPGDRSDHVGDSVSLQILASDPNADPLTYSASGLPGGLAIDPQTGFITGTIADDSGGAHAVTVTVSDGRLSVMATFSWNATCVADGGSSDPATGAYACPPTACATAGLLGTQGAWGTLSPNDESYTGKVYLASHVGRSWCSEGTGRCDPNDNRGSCDVNRIDAAQIQLVCFYGSADGSRGVGALTHFVTASCCGLSTTDPAAAFTCTPAGT
jgi:hypothetical protein